MPRVRKSDVSILQTIAYSALPSQRRFHALQERFKGFSGPIGSGKSQALCHEALRLAFINHGRTGLLGAPTYPMLRDATQATLLEILDCNSIRYDFNKAENTLILKDPGSRILFRAVEEFDRLRGTNLAWFGLDELTYTQEQAWVVLEGRLRDSRASRLGGFACWTPKGYDWVYRRFVQERVPGYAVVLAQPFENRFLLERVPDFYDRLKRSYDPKFYEQEVLGEYLNLRGGRVYHAFDRAAHIRAASADRHLPVRWALDFNVDPMSSVIVQFHGPVIAVLDEIVMSRASTRQACEEFLNRYGKCDAGIHVYGDASGGAMHTVGGSDYGVVRAMLSRVGPVWFHVPKSNPPVRDRVGAVNAKLRNASGEIELAIDPKCRELIRDLEEVVYKGDTGVIDKETDPRRTHTSDALGYLIWEETRSRLEAGEKSERFPGC